MEGRHERFGGNKAQAQAFFVDCFNNGWDDAAEKDQNFRPVPPYGPHAPPNFDVSTIEPVAALSYVPNTISEFGLYSVNDP